MLSENIMMSNLQIILKVEFPYTNEHLYTYPSQAKRRLYTEVLHLMSGFVHACDQFIK